MIFKGPLPYEGLLQLPLIVAGPGVAAGAVVDDPVGTIDLAPTMLRAAGVGLPDHLEGSALDADGHDAVFTEVDFAALLPVRMRILTTRTHKVVRYPDSPELGELYDLGDDPGEFENRWDDPASAAVKAELLEQLHPYERPLARKLPSTGLVA